MMAQFGNSNSTDSDVSSPVQFHSRFDQNFEIDANNRILGKGGFGIVFKTKDKLDQQCYAVKRIKMPRSSDERRKNVLREVQTLAKLDHCNIVRYFSAWEEFPPLGWQETWDKDHEISDNSESFESDTEKTTSEERMQRETDKTHQTLQKHSRTASDSIVFESDSSIVSICHGGGRQTANSTLGTSLSEVFPFRDSNSFVYIQTQLCHEGTLKDWLEKHISMEERKEILKIFYEITCALDYLHSRGLMHRDLKPSNIFLTSGDSFTNGDCGLKAKLGDFGLVKDFLEKDVGESQTAGSRRHTNEVGTRWYMSPEQVGKTGDYDIQTDIFSLGLILLELCQPFVTDSEKYVTFQDARKGKLPSRLSKEHKAEGDLVRKMLSSDPSQRPTANDILKHPLLRQFGRKSIVWSYLKSEKDKTYRNALFAVCLLIIFWILLPRAFFSGYFL